LFFRHASYNNTKNEKGNTFGFVIALEVILQTKLKVKIAAEGKIFLLFV
jgi:hypothetical protein